MKGFTKDSYLTVQFIYADYSDFMEMFENSWNRSEAINWMMDSEFHNSKIEETELKEIIVSRTVKYEKP